MDAHAHLDYWDLAAGSRRCADRLSISHGKMFVNFNRQGNTSAAAVAIALDEAKRTGRIKRADYVLMVRVRRRALRGEHRY